MKTKISLLLLFFLLTGMEIHAQGIDITGTWKLEGDKLTCSLSMNENLVDIIWDFEFKDNVINLKRTSPDGSTSVVNSFKRK